MQIFGGKIKLPAQDATPDMSLTTQSPAVSPPSVVAVSDLARELRAAFPLFDDNGLSEEEHHCEWTLQQDRKRLHAKLAALESFASRMALGGERDAERLLRDLLDYVDRETCRHEETHRGGAIWTICDQCNRKWADDRGGFEPYQDAPVVAEVREHFDRAIAAIAKQADKRGGERDAGNGGGV